MLKEFRLPTYLELSKNQDRILRKLHNTDRAIVAGAPGTGKSVIILLLAEKLKNDKKPYLCLLYNNVLKNMSLSLMPNVNINTWHSWFKKYFVQSYKVFPPEIEPFKYDWNKIDEIISKHEELPENTELTIIIDEGQDMPPEFYGFINEYFKAIFVSADENQQICQEKSCLKDIKDELEVKQGYCFELNENYRNTKQIAQLAESFYCNTRAKPPELPERDGEIPMLIEHSDKNRIIERIANRHKVNPKKLIGILTPKDEVREEYYTELKQIGISDLYTYSSKDKYQKQYEQIKFDSGGIVVLNSQSVKGLEFDEVFIVELEHFYYSDSDAEAFRKKMYVLTSRAKENLFIIIDTFRNMDGKPDKRRQILAQFPSDEQILRRWKEQKGSNYEYRSNQ